MIFAKFSSRIRHLPPSHTQLSMITQQPGWDTFYENCIVGSVEAILARSVEYSGIPAIARLTEKRGLEKMLANPILAVAAGGPLSFHYARVFREIRPNPKYKGGDPPDWSHALSSSIADVFVTHDADLAFWFRRVPHRSVEILDLPSLLDRS